MPIIRPLFLVIFQLAFLQGFTQWKEIEFEMFKNYNVYDLDPKIIAPDTIAVNISYRLNVRPWSTHSKTFLSTDNGENWDSVFSDRWCYYITSKKLYSVRNDSMFYSVDEGHTWTYKSNLLENGNLNIVNESTLYVFNQEYGLISDNYGSSWDTIPLPNYIYNSQPEIFHFYPSSKDEIKAIISIDGQKLPVYLIESNNSGANWDTTRIIDATYFDGFHRKIYIARDSLMFYTGNSELLSSLISPVSWDTSSFFSVKAEKFANPNIMSFYKNTIIVACTLSNKKDSSLAISHDFGKTWKWQCIGNSTHYSYGYLEHLSLYNEVYGVAGGSEPFLYLFDQRNIERPKFTYSLNEQKLTTINQSDTNDSYSWKWGEGSKTDSFNAIHNYSSTGTYNLCLERYGSGTSCYSDSCIIVKVGSCNALFGYEKDTGSAYSIVVVDSSTGSNLDYTWYWGDGDSSTSIQPYHQYASFGKFLVSLKVETNHCISIFSDSLGMDSLGNLLKTDGFSIVTKHSSLDELNAPTILIYPNPASSSLNIIVNQGEIQDVDVFTYDGKELAFRFLKQGARNWSLTINQPNGLYLVRVNTDRGIFYKKIGVLTD